MGVEVNQPPGSNATVGIKLTCGSPGDMAELRGQAIANIEIHSIAGKVGSVETVLPKYQQVTVWLEWFLIDMLLVPVITGRAELLCVRYYVTRLAH